MSQPRFKSNDGDFDKQAKDLAAYMRANQTRLNLTDAAVDDAEAQSTLFSTHLGAHDTAFREERRTAAINESTRAATVTLFSTMITNMGDLFTNEDRAANEMPLLTGPGERIPAPTTYPNLSISNGPPNELMVLAMDANNPTKRGKPDGVEGLELRWNIMDGTGDDDPDMWHPGPTPSDLRSAIAVRLKPVYKGKTVGVIGRYRNSSGSGPWGNITTATLT